MWRISTRRILSTGPLTVLMRWCGSSTTTETLTGPLTAKISKSSRSSLPALSIDEVAKALTSLRREHQHTLSAKQKSDTRKKALKLLPRGKTDHSEVTSKATWIWLNNGVYFHARHESIEPYITWALECPDKIDKEHFPAILNSLSHIFRPVQSTGQPPVIGISESLKEKARQVFEGDFLSVALKLTQSGPMKGVDAILLVSAFSRMSVLEDTLYENLAKLLQPELPKLKFGELANVASSLARVSVFPGEFFEKMLPRAKATVAVGSPKEISTLGNAILRSGAEDKDFFNLAAVAMTGRVRRCKSYELAGLINTFAKAGVVHEETSRSLVEFASIVGVIHFTRTEICFVLPAILKLPAKSATLFEVLAPRVVKELIPTLKASEVQALFCAYAKSESRKTGEVIRALLSKIEEFNDEYGSQEALTLLDALTRLPWVLSRAELNSLYKSFEFRAMSRLLEGGVTEVVSFVSILSRDSESFAIMPNIVKTCREQLKQNLSSISVQELSVLTNALSRDCCKFLLNEEISASLMEQCQRLLPECKAIDIAALLSFLTSANAQGGEAFSREALKAVSSAIPHMGTTELSTTANSISRISIPEACDVELWKRIEDHACKLKGKLTATQIGGLMSAFVRVQITPKRFFSEIVDPLVTRHAMSLSAHELCEILGAYAKRNFEEDTVFASLADRVCQVAPQCTTHELSTILHSFAKFGIRNETVFYDFLPHVLRHAPKMKSAELSTVIVAYARIGVWNLRVFTALSERMKEILEECSTQDIASVLNAFANMDMKDEAFFRACGDRVVQLSTQCTPREMVSILHAFHEVDFEHDALLNEFLTRLSAENVAQNLSIGDCIFIATSMPRIRRNVDERLATIYDALARRFTREASLLLPTALASILHAFYRKRITVPSAGAMFEALTLRAAADVENYQIRNLAILLGAVTKSENASHVPLAAFVPRLLQLIPQCNAHNLMTVSTAFASESESLIRSRADTPDHREEKPHRCSPGTATNEGEGWGEGDGGAGGGGVGVESHEDVPSPLDPESSEQVLDALLARTLHLLPSLRSVRARLDPTQPHPALRRLRVPRDRPRHAAPGPRQGQGAPPPPRGAGLREPAAGVRAARGGPRGGGGGAGGGARGGDPDPDPAAGGRGDPGRAAGDGEGGAGVLGAGGGGSTGARGGLRGRGGR